MGLSEGRGNEREAADLADRAIEKASKKGKGKRGKAEPTVGRKDGEGQEAVIDVGALKKVMPKAIKLEKELADARHDASEAYKRWAKETGLNTAQLKAAAKAYANEETEAARRKAEQMSLIFEECGQ